MWHLIQLWQESKGEKLRILISRIDKIGDVILTLPLAGWLKQKYPTSQIYFLGQNYTSDVIKLSGAVDHVIEWNELSASPIAQKVLSDLKIDIAIHVFPNSKIAWLCKKANIPIRIGTSHRWYHWFTCNHLSHFSRKNSHFHEAQLNFKLIVKNDSEIPALNQIPTYYELKTPPPPPKWVLEKLSKDKLNIILHPKSKGSAREWPLENFSKLISIAGSKYNFLISGGPNEKELLSSWISKHPEAVDLTGALTLAELVSVINASDGLIAASTGPLHIASSLGVSALGLYPPIKPMDPNRWAPLGKKATFLVENKNCNSCLNQTSCPCMNLIIPEQVFNVIQSWKKTVH